MPEKWGYNFQYRVPADDFIDTALALFDRAIKSLQEIKQVRGRLDPHAVAGGSA